jgi:hypothetical protein
VVVGVAEVGDFEEGSGAQFLLVEDQLKIVMRMDGHEAEAAVRIELLLEAIMVYTRERGN